MDSWTGWPWRSFPALVILWFTDSAVLKECSIHECCLPLSNSFVSFPYTNSILLINMQVCSFQCPCSRPGGIWAHRRLLCSVPSGLCPLGRLKMVFIATKTIPNIELQSPLPICSWWRNVIGRCWKNFSIEDWIWGIKLVNISKDTDHYWLQVCLCKLQELGACKWCLCWWYFCIEKIIITEK